MNTKFKFRRSISTLSFKQHEDVIKKFKSFSKKQGAVDCHFVTNKFLLADKPLYNENWWRRIIYGNNGTTHIPKKITSGLITPDDIIGAWKEYGQVKLHAKHITVTPDSSLNGKGTRFSEDSFHCINIVKIFSINRKPYTLSYDPEANCGLSDIERINSINPACYEMSELTTETTERIQSLCAMYRIDDLYSLLRKADTITHPDSGLYVAKEKHWL
ncbi:hypothetical protein [Microbulbifer sp.]|uniref:hypothetical protein n=1 Tax=Microbulbifer sp. TaxID=1908541 RepID=UPI003F3D7AFB